MNSPNLHWLHQRYIQVFLIIFILFFTVYSDQYTKSLAKKLLAGREASSYGAGSLIFSYVENNAGFLQIFEFLPESIRFFILYICVGLILLTCLYYLFIRRMQPWQAITLAVITGGGISNLLDRFTNNGGVIDFIQVGIGPLKTGIFNLADFYILGGSFIFGFILFSNSSKE